MMVASAAIPSQQSPVVLQTSSKYSQHIAEKFHRCARSATINIYTLDNFPYIVPQLQNLRPIIVANIQSGEYFTFISLC